MEFIHEVRVKVVCLLQEVPTDDSLLQILDVVLCNCYTSLMPFSSLSPTALAILFHLSAVCPGLSI